MLLGVLTQSAEGGGGPKNKAGLWHNLIIWLLGSEPVWLRKAQLLRLLSQWIVSGSGGWWGCQEEVKRIRRECKISFCSSAFDCFVP